jgi:hypothetical protein
MLMLLAGCRQPHNSARLRDCKTAQQSNRLVRVVERLQRCAGVFGNGAKQTRNIQPFVNRNGDDGCRDLKTADYD